MGKQRKSYHVRRAGRYINGDEEDYQESAKEKMVRLMREVEELKVELAEQRDQPHRIENDAKAVDSDEDTKAITDLTNILRDLQTQTIRSSNANKTRPISAATPATRDIPKTSEASPSEHIASTSAHATAQSTEAIEAHTSRVLSHATALEARLAALETLIGSSPTEALSIQAKTATTKPALTQLDLLESQLSVVTSTSSFSLESMSSQIQHLLNETSRLTTARQEATTALQKLQTQRSMGVPKGIGHASLAAGNISFTPLQPESSTVSPMQSVLQDPEHLARVQKLYDVLPTIEATLPLVPAVVERLRTLRAVHSDAASARQDLKELERRQGEVSLELGKWREGVERLEAAMAEGRVGDKQNREEVEKWVKELEARLTRLG